MTKSEKQRLVVDLVEFEQVGIRRVGVVAPSASADSTDSSRHPAPLGIEAARVAGLISPALTSLAAATDAALARIWVTGEGDLCATCAMRPECPDQTRCLHLVASAGATDRVGGRYQRFPFGAREVGRVALSRESLRVDADLEASGLAEREWLEHHAVRSFAAVALVRGGECYGVLAVFSRRVLSTADVAWLEAAGEAFAAAIAAAREDEHVWLRPIADSERDLIARVLRHTGGRVSGPRGAAAILGMRPTTLDSRMKKLGVAKPARGTGKPARGGGARPEQ